MEFLAAIVLTTYLCCRIRLNPGIEEQEEMDLLSSATTAPAARLSSKEFRRCASIKSRKNPDTQCPYAAIQADYCARHSKNPHPFRPRLPTLEEPVSPRSSMESVKAARLLQRLWRQQAPRLRFRNQGPAANALELATNESELYSLDCLASIPQPYLFTFSDDHKTIWAFDIRTLSHSMASGYPQQNPYTREKLPAPALQRLHARIEWLRRRKYQIFHLCSEELTEEQVWKQKVLDIFLKIEALGYYASNQWFHALSLWQQEEFYKKLFTLWEWRLGLTISEKERIVPGQGGVLGHRLFRYPANELPRKEKGWWEKHNLGVIEALVSRSPDKEQRKLGALYVLMALVQVSREAAYALPWVVETVA